MSQALATTSTHDPASRPADDDAQLVTFTIGDQLFGVPVLRVRDILQLGRIAAVPLAPPAVRGAINLRGRIVTVIDVRARLGLDATVMTEGERQMGVTVEQGAEFYTLMVDGLGDVISPGADRFEKLPGTVDPAWRHVSSGVYRLEDRLMVVLDIDRLLDIGGG